MKLLIFILVTLVFIRPVYGVVNELNVITSLSSSDPMYQGLLKFKQGVETATNKDIIVRIFVGSQLGSDNDILEQARAGANVAVLVDGGRLAIYQNEMGILGAPYLASGLAEVKKIVTSTVFNAWAAQLSQNAGLKVLSFNWWQGERHLLTHKEINHPDDLIGVRIRTIGAPVWLETIRALGATPTPLGWTEVYSALQQKVIDGAEAQHPGTWGSRLYEVITYITKTAHINLISGLVGSATWFDKLSIAHQLIVTEQAFLAGEFASQLNFDLLAEYETKMRDYGVVIHEVDTRAFIEATNKTYDVLGYTELRAKLKLSLKQ
ncbi:C4-dicarboxylate TRAP transporter substrate-binding protein [Psychrosphaera sp. 1_MG-2023]|uniref:C4-dicarboxylate TRAP transporter substrate-binding protein n=1 Tax=Psychrosphaera sp. 1_MG-2023 TaxID=3062643 RepID=UPI0026E1A912|nr:C4-dicarboxylate TRAP transporter substrate-binding protein [Psychrosphaera sp. 1_MG-2023]MDO6718656.1 C4-dicarboxylate TRAP transporter substrate-binding protein [Psychrosphaera sp. 1_MG-2023]